MRFIFSNDQYDADNYYLFFLQEEEIKIHDNKYESNQKNINSE